MRIELEFSITSYCQAGCPSCQRTEILKERNSNFIAKHVSLDKIFKVAKNIPEGTLVSLCGEYGDPVMHPDVFKIIEVFTERDLFVCIDTNGGLRNEKFYKTLANNKKVNFSFGIDGLDQETNEKYRVGVDFDRAWRNMNTWFSECKLKGRKPGTYGQWNFLIFDFNKHIIEDVYHYAKDHDINVMFKINRRLNFGYVGDSEYERLKKKINELK